MADQKLSARTEETTVQDSMLVHVAKEDGLGNYLSFKMRKDNLVKDITDSITSLPAWQTPLTGQTISWTDASSFDQIDTGQSTREPKDWKVYDSDGIEITSQLTFKESSLSGNYYLNIRPNGSTINNCKIVWYG